MKNLFCHYVLPVLKKAMYFSTWSLTLLYILIKSYYFVDDSPLFFQTESPRRTVLIICNIILKLSDRDFEIFIKQIEQNYKDLFLINNIFYGLNREKIQKDEHSQKRAKQIFLLKEKIVNEIKINKINMYDKDNYNRNNMSVLFNDEEYMKYISKNLNLNNLMLFVLDYISVSISTLGIGYIFNLNNLNKFYGWINVKRNLKKCDDNELKSFLLNAIENLIEEDEQSVFYTEDWISLNQLVTNYLNRD